jgi:hypothetical protein
MTISQGTPVTNSNAQTEELVVQGNLSGPATFTRNDFLEDLALATRLTSEINANPSDAERLQTSRRHAREGQRRWRERDTE